MFFKTQTFKMALIKLFANNNSLSRMKFATRRFKISLLCRSGSR